MKKTYVIVDDDAAFIMLLKKQLSHFDHLHFLASYSSTIEGAKGITKLKPDILFLDMEIDSLDGLDVLEVLDPKPKTIVISSKTEFRDQAMELEALDYIKKGDLSVERLQMALQKIEA